jgi:hypothetical protein
MNLKMILIGIACIAIGWLGSTAERSAHAQVSPPGAMRAGEWADMGEANGTQVWRFVDSGRTCYVTSSGGISCGR